MQMSLVLKRTSDSDSNTNRKHILSSGLREKKVKKRLMVRKIRGFVLALKMTTEFLVSRLHVMRLVLRGSRFFEMTPFIWKETAEELQWRDFHH